MILTSNIVPLNNLAAVEDLHSDLILYIEFFIFMIFVCFFSFDEFQIHSMNCFPNFTELFAFCFLDFFQFPY